MPEEVLTPEIKAFLKEHVASLEHLEVLLLLCGAPERKWTVPEVYDVIKSSHESVTEVLTHLRNAGFLAEAVSQVYQYRPTSEQVREMISKVAALYRTHRIRVIEFIYSPTTDPLNEFSRAFRLRREQ